MNEEAWRRQEAVEPQRPGEASDPEEEDGDGLDALPNPDEGVPEEAGYGYGV